MSANGYTIPPHGGTLVNRQLRGVLRDATLEADLLSPTRDTFPHGGPQIWN